VLHSRVRKRDTLARLGGDEFGALLEHCPIEQAQHIAEQLLHAVREFKFLCRDRCFNVGVSIGLVPMGELGGTMPEIMSAADRACYAAKEQGRNRIQLYRIDDEELARTQCQMRWVPRIQQALAENRLRLQFQPIVSLSSPQAAVEHCEALIRMIDENGTVVLPGAFLRAAERFDQMRAVDKWVLEHALDEIRACPPERCPTTISVNISGQSLCDGHFLAFVVAELGEGDVASRLCFEITETAAITNYRHALQFISELRSRGCRFALDDFGSGVSSFHYLRDLHVDFIKIDGRFISGMLGDVVDSAVVKAVHQIAQVMNIKTIAQYVENEHTAIKLQAMGVDFAQGGFFAAPCEMKELLQISSATLRVGLRAECSQTSK
jgi:EAL domain-containing protein (putative c-di-GMP-specific phosphodiesterase class I)